MDMFDFMELLRLALRDVPDTTRIAFHKDYLNVLMEDGSEWQVSITQIRNAREDAAE